jgi:glycine C-acetyltransferase
MWRDQGVSRFPACTGQVLDVMRGRSDDGTCVVGFRFPIVPEAWARIGAQLAATHGKHDLDRAINAFRRVGEQQRSFA